MPIYAYRCESCGFAKDVLQKVSDALLSDCPECGKSSFKKQLTAAGFQLKGSGWYVTDFKNGASGGAGRSDAAGGESGGRAEGEKGDVKPAGASLAASAPAPSPAGGEAGSADGTSNSVA